MALNRSRMMTADVFTQRYAGNEVRAELVRGVVHEMSPALPPQGRYTMRISLPIAQYVEAHVLGEVFAAETGFLIRHPDGSESVRAPDLAFIRAERLPEEEPQGFWAIAPDLVVEVLSTNDTPQAVSQKVQMWLEAGVLLVWVVNPVQHTVSVHRADGSTQTLTEGDTLSGEEVLKGFELPVRQIFRSVRRVGD